MQNLLFWSTGKETQLQLNEERSGTKSTNERKQNQAKLAKLAKRNENEIKKVQTTNK